MNKPVKRLLIVACAAAGVAAIVLGLICTARSRGESDGASADRTDRRISVVLTPVRQMVFEERLEVSGNIEAKSRALLSARMPGPVDAIYVDEGDAVEADKTELFLTDSLKLTKAVEIASKNLLVAKCLVREVEARLEQTQAQNELNRADLGRYEHMAKKGVATRHEVESYQSKFRQSQAAVKHVEASIDLAEAQLQLAESRLAMARKDLADALVIAPLSGRVSQKLLEPGEMAAAGTPVLRVDDLSVLEVSAYLPGEYYSRIEPGKTQMRVRANGSDLGLRTLSYKSPTVSPKLRTFEVKCVIAKPPVGVAPGLLAKIVIVLDRHDALGVPSEAVQPRAGKDVVFVHDNGAARMVAVRVGLQMEGWALVRGQGLTAGMPVVSMGQYYLNDKDAVRVVEGVR